MHRRRVRVLLIVCLVASPLLFVAAAIGWVQSVVKPTSFKLWTWPVPGTTATEGYAARSEGGRFDVYSIAITPLRLPDGSIGAYAPSVDRAASIPYWAVGMGCVAIALTCWRVRRRRGDVARDACRICGYDLRATPERCPECGSCPTGGGAAL